MGYWRSIIRQRTYRFHTFFGLLDVAARVAMRWRQQRPEILITSFSYKLPVESSVNPSFKFGSKLALRKKCASRSRGKRLDIAIKKYEIHLPTGTLSYGHRGHSVTFVRYFQKIIGSINVITVRIMAEVVARLVQLLKGGNLVQGEKPRIFEAGSVN